LNNLASICPACKKSSIKNRGKLIQKVELINLKSPGNLFCCNNCGLFFRRPYASTPQLEKNYSELKADNWSKKSKRTDFDIAKKVLNKLPTPGRILDVGCFRGDFLASLSDEYIKYGVEPAESARLIARECGIVLIGKFIDKIKLDYPMFNSITLLDVIEHLPHPMVSIQKLKKLLLPGGVLIISTGNTDVIPWRLLRCSYWYYFSSHVSFFNPRWFNWLAKKLNFSILSIDKFARVEGTIFTRWHQFAQSLAYYVFNENRSHFLINKIFSKIYPFNKVSKWQCAPITSSWKDHMLVVLKLKS